MTIDTNPNSPNYGQYVNGPAQGQSAPMIGGQLYQGPIEQAPAAIQQGQSMGQQITDAPRGAGINYGGNSYSPQAFQQQVLPWITPPRVGEPPTPGMFNPNAQLDPSQVGDRRNTPWYQWDEQGMGGQHYSNQIMPPGMGFPPNSPPGTFGSQITPPNVGGAGMQAPGMMSPNGRTFDQITGTDYLSPEERVWYLNQIGKTVDPVTGAVVPYQSQITPPSLTGGAGGAFGQQAFPNSPTQGSIGPNGRTFDQVTGTDYLSPQEREWYLAQSGKTVTASGAVVGGNPTGTAKWNAWGEGPGGSMLGFGALGHPTAGSPYAGQSTFSPEVEQWRQLVSQYFRPEDVNKALYIISKESGGVSQVQHGGGPGTGLFQVEHGGYWPGRPSQQELLDPATNIAYAASMVYG